MQLAYPRPHIKEQVEPETSLDRPFSSVGAQLSLFFFSSASHRASHYACFSYGLLRSGSGFGVSFILAGPQGWRPLWISALRDRGLFPAPVKEVSSGA
jgi:hypothetical protein